jgi:hypothetical protein
MRIPMFAEARGRAISPAPIAVPETKNIAPNNLVITISPYKKVYGLKEWKNKIREQDLRAIVLTSLYFF